MITSNAILDLLQRQPRHQATFKQMVKELGGRGAERQRLRMLLSDLLREKKLRELRHAYQLAPERPAKAAQHSRPAGASGTRRIESDGGGNRVHGRISLHADGFGFVLPDRDAPDAGADIFIPPPMTGGAMHGDRVEVELTRTQAGGQRRAGKVVRILRRLHATVVGTFHATPRQNYIQPFDYRLSQRIFIPPGEEQPAETDLERHRVIGREAKVTLPAGRRGAPAAREARAQNLDGLVVEVEVTDYGSATRPLRGKVIEVLGARDDFGVDVEIIIRKHHLPHRFADAVLDEARRLHAKAHAGFPLEGRRDFRHLPIVTIDGESARDFDDAVHVERLPGGGFALQVHIADVAHYVQPDSELDHEARLRGTSVYFPDRAIPMLPTELSTDLCSLRPLEERPVMSCLMEITPAGEIAAYEIVPGVIRSAARLTYTRVNQQLQAVIADEYAASLPAADLPPDIDWLAMLELQQAFYAKRQRDGSIDFDLPEPEISFDEFGLMRSIVKSERNVAHRLIEEYMLAANQAVALHLERQNVASIYRIHDVPDPAKVLEFEEIAAGFGYSLSPAAMNARQPVTRKRDRRQQIQLAPSLRVAPRNYQQLAARISGKPEERILSYLMLRSLPQARYNPANSGHFALAMATYTHFTSPIRRYPDLLVHRILKRLLPPGGSGRQLYRARRYQPESAPFPPPEELAASPLPYARLRALARESSDAERRAEEAERDLLDWKKVRFMETRLGERFSALVTNANKNGCFVELLDLFIEGLVPAATLEDDGYRFQPGTREWVGQHSRRHLRIGDHLDVLVERIDPVRNRIHFALAETDE